MTRQKPLGNRIIRPAVLLAILGYAANFSVAATYRLLYGFSGGTEGGGLYSGVVIDSEGNLYGGTVGGGNGGGGTIYEIQRQGDGTWKKTLIHDLDFHNDGGNPNNGMVFDPTGNLYGTTGSGGQNLVGTVFQLVPSQSGAWALNVILNEGSLTGLAIDPIGNLYGFGGPGQYNDGNVFRLSPSPAGWQYQEIFSFGGRSDDASRFLSPMIMDAAGNLYGTSEFGGNTEPYCAGSAGCGVVFKLHPNPDGTWTEHLLHKFAAWKYDGMYAFGGVVRDRAGNVYGTTLEGGTHRDNGQCLVGCGTIYQLSRQPNGHWKETILYNFPRFKDGLGPAAGLVMDSAGNLYGTTGVGGDHNCNCGVAFEFAPNPDGTWTYTVLHRFHGYDGSGPVAPLVMDKKGHLYGTTTFGGPGGYGVVFKITP